MNKEIISNTQGISMMALFIAGSTFALGTAAAAKQDIWLAIIIAILFSLIAVVIYAAILTEFPGKNLFEILEYVFGSVIGKVISVLYIWYFFHLAALVLTNFGQFVNKLGMTDTPKLVIECFFMFIVVLGVRQGIELLGKCSIVFLIMLLVTEFVSITFKIPIINLNHLKPFLYDGLKPVMNSAFSTFSFPFAETIVFMVVFNGLRNKKSYYRVYIIGILIGGLAVLAASVFEMMVLGKVEYLKTYFPTYVAIGRIKFPGFIERIEASISVAILLGGFLKISICLLACCKGISNLFNINDYRFLVTIIAILAIILSSIVYENTMEMVEWAVNVYSYYALVFQVILPIIIFIIMKIRIGSKEIRGVK